MKNGANECRCWHSGSWTGSTISFCTVTPQLLEQLQSLPSRERMEPDTYTKVSIFHNQLSEPYVGGLLHKSIQRYSSVEIEISELKILLCKTHFPHTLFTYIRIYLAK